MQAYLFPLCPRHHVSITKGMHVLLVQKSQESQKAKGFPNLVKARAKLQELTKAGLDPRKAENKAKVQQMKEDAKQALPDALVPAVGTGRVYSNSSASSPSVGTAIAATANPSDQSNNGATVGAVVNALTCTECNPYRQFYTKSTLSHHRMMEHSNRRYNCEWALQGKGCDRMGKGKGYSTKANLRKHINSQHGGVAIPPADT